MSICREILRVSPGDSKRGAVVCEESGEECVGGSEAVGDNLCESRRWSILANFVFI